jgi:hypothetical protein
LRERLMGSALVDAEGFARGFVATVRKLWPGAAS